MEIQTELSNQDSKEQERESEKLITLCETMNTGTFSKWGNGASREMGWMFMHKGKFAVTCYRWCQTERFHNFSLPANSFNDLQRWGVTTEAHTSHTASVMMCMCVLHRSYECTGRDPPSAVTPLSGKGKWRQSLNMKNGGIYSISCQRANICIDSI